MTQEQLRAAVKAMLAADTEWANHLQRVYGKDANYARYYLREYPDAELQAAYEARKVAMTAYHDAQDAWRASGQAFRFTQP